MSAPTRPRMGSVRLTTIAIGAFIGLPIASTLVAATTANFAQGPWGGGFTVMWLQQGAAQIGPMLGRSLVVALLVTAADLVIGGGLAYWIARRDSLAGRLVRRLMDLPLAVPGIALSIGLITLYPALRPSGTLLVLGHILFTLPFALATLIPTLRDPDLIDQEQVATTLGGSRLRILRSLTAPTALVSSIQVMMMVFAISFGEFNISFFINPPATSMAPFGLFDAYSTQRIEIGSAETVIFLAVLVPVLCGFLVLRRVLSPRKERH